MTRQKIEIKTLSAKKSGPAKNIFCQKCGPAMAGPAVPPTTALTSFFSSLEQCSGRTIVLPPASALANFNGHMIDLIYILYANRYWNQNFMPFYRSRSQAQNLLS